jgi:ferredoxin
VAVNKHSVASVCNAIRFRQDVFGHFGVEYRGATFFFHERLPCLTNSFYLCDIEANIKGLYNSKKIKIMAYVITDDCVMCGSCAGECPSGAISEGDGKYVIDADACVDCGTCADACPTGAITPGE